MAAPHQHLSKVRDAAEVVSARLIIPVCMIDLHRAVPQSKNQQAVRWGAFLLTYAPIEGFFNEILDYRTSKSRSLPLNPDKIRDAALTQHGVKLFDSRWSVRTRTPSGTGNTSRWSVYDSTKSLREYLSDMKTLRDRLAHGQDPYLTTNSSSALWSIKKGVSMRLMGVEGFLQAACDLVDQTIVTYGGCAGDLSRWPEPVRSGLSSEDRPPIPMIDAALDLR